MFGGVFTQHTHNTNYDTVYPGNTPTKARMLNSKTMQLKRVVFSSSHLSKNMYWTQYIWVPCVKEHVLKGYSGTSISQVCSHMQPKHK